MLIKKAVLALTAYPSKITSGAEAQKLDGIGKKISAKIDEILATGQLRKLNNYNSDEKTVAINLISRVSGIGPSGAKKYVVEKGVRTLDDLRKIEHELTHHQKIGLKYFEEFETKIPRAEMKILESIVKETIKELDPLLIATVCGSYRRGLPQSGDVDFLITNPNYTSDKKKDSDVLDKLVPILKKKKFITDDLSHGKIKYNGVCILPEEINQETRLHRRIDFRLIPFDQFYCGLLYFTGSDYFNRNMRVVAQERGFTLSEYSINAAGETGIKGEPLEVFSEKDVFDILGMPYKKPKERSI